jgi:integrase
MQHTSAVIHKFYPAFNFHSLRHTHCTRLLEAGLPIKYVQERLGHKNISVTMDIYNHLTQNQAEQSKKALENVFK